MIIRARRRLSASLLTIWNTLAESGAMPTVGILASVVIAAVPHRDAASTARRRAGRETAVAWGHRPHVTTGVPRKIHVRSAGRRGPRGVVRQPRSTRIAPRSARGPAIARRRAWRARARRAGSGAAPPHP